MQQALHLPPCAMLISAVGFGGKDEQPEIAGGEQLTEEDPEFGSATSSALHPASTATAMRLRDLLLLLASLLRKR